MIAVVTRQIRRRARVSIATALAGSLALVSTPGFALEPGAPKPAPVQAASLKIDPRMIAEAAEVWALVGTDNNPIWPGWNAADTPLLFYLPGEQDVLINHPDPPAGFISYQGPVEFPGGRILIRNGPTLFQWDGQNTSTDVEGVQTLVVADALSNLRLQVLGMLEAPRPEVGTIEPPSFAQLATDPYAQLSLIVHEAFHVYEDRIAPDKGANEMLLLGYPVLSVENNVGFAQEGAALARALAALEAASRGSASATAPGAPVGSAFRNAAITWLAVRADRRSRLPARAVEYEDGIEFTEGLAKYTEYRLFQVLEGRTPAAEMWWVQGFHGYDDLSSNRSGLVDEMVKHMRGEVPVNNDPYGTAPLRLRLYYSGMAIGVLLDRLSVDWKHLVLQPGSSLTGLVAETIKASKDELAVALDEARRQGDLPALLGAKAELARKGQARIDTMLAAIYDGAGSGLIIDYSALEKPEVAIGFTPFGIIAADEDRTIYTQVPIQVRFGDRCQIVEAVPLPVLQDKREKSIRLRLSRVLTAGEVDKAFGPQSRAEPDRQAEEAEQPQLRQRDMDGLRVDLPEVTVSAQSSTVGWDGRDLRIRLKAGRR